MDGSTICAQDKGLDVEKALRYEAATLVPAMRPHFRSSQVDRSKAKVETARRTNIMGVGLLMVSLAMEADKASQE